MTKLKTIAIYSGRIPSTTFIERLIKSLAHSGNQILLFGVKQEKNEYESRNIQVIGYRNNKLSKVWTLLRYSFLLFLFKNSKLRQLNFYLKSINRFNIYYKVKCYPVLWHQPDIFHLQWAKGLKDWIWVEQFDMNLVVSLRGAHINYSPIASSYLAEFYKKTFPKVSGFHAVSKAIAKEAEKYGAHPDKIRIVYSGLKESNKRLKQLEFNRPFKIISVGRPHWKKGYSYALDACKILKTEGFSFNYTIIGGAGNMELLYQISELDLKENVTLEGSKPFDEVENYMLNSDLLLLPSVEEGIANVVLESMSLGTLVLSSDCGGMREVVNNDVNGFLIPIRDAKAIADKILYIGSLSTDYCLKIRKAALATISRNHSNLKMSSDMLSLYEDFFSKSS